MVLFGFEMWDLLFLLGLGLRDGGFFGYAVLFHAHLVHGIEHSHTEEKARGGADSMHGRRSEDGSSQGQNHFKPFGLELFPEDGFFQICQSSQEEGEDKAPNEATDNCHRLGGYNLRL